MIERIATCLIGTLNRVEKDYPLYGVLSLC